MSFTFCPSKVISIHALREEGDQARMRPLSCGENFYPRPPRGGRRMSSPLLWVSFCISIHALREEGDVRLFAFVLSRLKFLSTPSARRATALPARPAQRRVYFYPRPPRGGRHRDGRVRGKIPEISIHALREEGDFLTQEEKSMRLKFLSTPSARRATEHDRRGA